MPSDSPDLPRSRPPHPITAADAYLGVAVQPVDITLQQHTDSHGSILYRSGITTPADRLQMPPNLWARVAALINPDNLSPRCVPQLESDHLWTWHPPPDWL